MTDAVPNPEVSNGTIPLIVLRISARGPLNRNHWPSFVAASLGMDVFMGATQLAPFVIASWPA